MAQEVLQVPIITDSDRVCWLYGRGLLTRCSAVDVITLSEISPQPWRRIRLKSRAMHSIECAAGRVMTVGPAPDLNLHPGR